LRGVLLDCLNILRLQCQALAPRAFLRQYLTSHDAWKSFLPTLVEYTKEQQFGSRSDAASVVVPVPPRLPQQQRNFSSSLVLGVDGDKKNSIDLSSPFAIKLGFEGVVEYDPAKDDKVDDGTTTTTTNNTAALDNDDNNNAKGAGGGKKKKKNNKRKKKK